VGEGLEECSLDLFFDTLSKLACSGSIKARDPPNSLR